MFSVGHVIDRDQLTPRYDLGNEGSSPEGMTWSFLTSHLLFVVISVGCLFRSFSSHSTRVVSKTESDVYSQSTYDIFLQLM